MATKPTAAGAEAFLDTRPAVFEEIGDTFQTAREITSQEVNEKSKLQQKEDQCPNELIFKDAEDKAHDHSEKKAKR